MSPESERDSALAEFRRIAEERRRLIVKCARCGKDIPVGQEVRKGLLRRRSYHKGTCVIYCDME